MAPTSLGQSALVDAIVKLNPGAWADPSSQVMYIESGDTDTAKIVNRYSLNAITPDDILYDGVANGTKVQRINVKSLNNRLGCYKYNESLQHGQCTFR